MPVDMKTAARGENMKIISTLVLTAIMPALIGGGKPAAAQQQASRHKVYDGPGVTFASQEPYTFDYGTQELKEFRVMAPLPPEIPGRQVAIKSELKLTTGMAKAVVKREASGMRRPFLYISETHAGGINVVKFVTSYAGTLRPYHLEAGPPDAAVPALTPEEVALYTAPNRELDFNDPDFQGFLDWAGLRKSAGESDYDFAKKAYYLTARHFSGKSGGPKHLVSLLCRATETDCGGFATFFSAICRANGLPARVLIGRWVNINGAPGDMCAAVHCQAEVWLEGCGWVNVDANQFCNQPDSRADDFFGRYNGDFVAMHFDVDLVGPKGESSVILQMAGVWYSTIGNADGSHNILTGSWISSVKPIDQAIVDHS